MRFHTVAVLTGATAVAAGNTATLLLPGFQGHDLQAGVLGSVCAQDRESVGELCQLTNILGGRCHHLPGDLPQDRRRRRLRYSRDWHDRRRCADLDAADER